MHSERLLSLSFSHTLTTPDAHPNRTRNAHVRSLPWPALNISDRLPFPLPLYDYLQTGNAFLLGFVRLGAPGARTTLSRGSRETFFLCTILFLFFCFTCDIFFSYFFILPSLYLSFSLCLRQLLSLCLRPEIPRTLLWIFTTVGHRMTATGKGYQRLLVEPSSGMKPTQGSCQESNQ